MATFNPFQATGGVFTGALTGNTFPGLSLQKTNEIKARAKTMSDDPFEQMLIQDDLHKSALSEQNHNNFMQQRQVGRMSLDAQALNTKDPKTKNTSNSVKKMGALADMYRQYGYQHGKNWDSMGDEELISRFNTKNPQVKQYADAFLTGNDESEYRLAQQLGISGSKVSARAKLSNNLWDNLWGNMKTKASGTVDSWKKFGQRAINNLGGNIYKGVLKKVLGDDYEKITGVNIDDYIDTVTDNMIENEVMDYQNKLNQAYAEREARNVDADVNSYYEQKGYTKLLKEGDFKGFLYKAFGDMGQNWDMPVIVAASVFQPEVGFALMATDTYARENQDAFETMINNGATYEEAEKGGVVVGLINAAVEVYLEKLLGGAETRASQGIRDIFKKNIQEEITKQGAGRMLLDGLVNQLKASGEEGLEEIVQQFVQNVAVKTVNENQDLFQGLGQAFEGGFYNPMNLLVGGSNIVSGVKNSGGMSNINTQTNANTQNNNGIRQGILDRMTDWGAQKITGTVSAQDKLYKAQEPRMNVLSNKKNLENRRVNSDRANQLIIENGYVPTNTTERLNAHQATLNKLWGQVMDQVNQGEGVTVDQTPMIDALSEYINSKKKLGVAGIESDIRALEAELESLQKMQEEGTTDLPTLEAKKQVYNDLIDWKEQEASEVYKGGIKLLTQEIGKIEDNILSEIPGEFANLKKDVGALLDTYEDVFKADMKNQRSKGMGLTETYSRIEGIGDTLGGIFQLFKGDVSGVAKGLGKLALGKSLAKAKDVDFLIEQGFKELANQQGFNESPASSKTAKYQTAYHGSPANFEKFDSSHMGEGEGAQAHGWGHYVAVEENTGRAYANKLKGTTRKGKETFELAMNLNGNEWNVIREITDRMDLEGISAEEGIESSIRRHEYQLEEAKNDLKEQKWVDDKKFYEKKIEDQKKMLDFARGLVASDFESSVGKRNLYEVEIPDPVKADTPTGKNYIEEDGKLTLKQTKDILGRAMEKVYGKMKPFNSADINDARKVAEQVFSDLSDLQKEHSINDFVKDVEEYAKEYKKSIADAIDDELLYHASLASTLRERKAKAGLYDPKETASRALNGRELYNELEDMLGSDKETSKFLESLGYDGIHYFGGRDGESYVIFNDDALEIKNHERYQKYGVADPNSQSITADEGLNIRNFKNGKTVQELAKQYGIDTKIVNKISTPEGQKAYGMYGDRLITLSKDLKESTVPHELLHAVFDMVDQSKRKSILDGVQKKLGVDDVQAEEWLADSFSEYYRTGTFGTQGLAKTFIEKVKQFFYNIKKYIDGTYANERQIRQMFNDIIDGKIEGEYGVYSDPRFQTVWHGSPYDFERFDSSHMGEGEGAQAHGRGHYVAVEERTGRHYAELKSGTEKPYEYEGQTYNEMIRDRNSYQDIYKSRKLSEIISLIDEWEQSNGKSLSEVLNNRKNLINKVLEDDKKTLANKSKGTEQYVIDNLNQFIENDEELLGILDEIDVNKINKIKDYKKNKNLYEIEIPDPVKADTPTGSNYLEEDGKITKAQMDKIYDEVVKEYEKKKQGKAKRVQNLQDGRLKTFRNLIDQDPGMLSDGKGLYSTLSNVLGGQEQASKFLESLGYDGIHYFGGRDGEAYVIFNDDALEIKKHEQY